jgi:hypothetical protein
MFRSFFERVFSEESLNQIFRDRAQKQVESDVLFSHLVGILVPVVSGNSKSVGSAYQAGKFDYSRQALYDKLKGVESSVSAGLLTTVVDKLLPIHKSANVNHADPVKGYHTYVIDGKTYNATEYRLRECRTDARAPLPGRSVAVFDTRHELFVDIECETNAHCSERKIVRPLLERLETGALYMADRNFADSYTLSAFIGAESYFITRQNKGCLSWRKIDQSRIQDRGQDENGNQLTEEKIEIKLTDGSWKTIRRITVKLSKPTRKGDTELMLLSNLPGRVSGKAIANAYRKRWTIETSFGHLARALNAEIKTLCYPKAAGLCFSIALVLFNLMSTIKALLKEHGQYSDRYEIPDLSYYYLADEILRWLTAFELVEDQVNLESITHQSHKKFIRTMKWIASKAILKKYRKHVRGEKKKPPNRKFNGSRHVATQKILDARK